MGIEIQPLPSGIENFTATFHLDINAMSPEALFERLEAVYRDFEHLRLLIRANEHGGDVTDQLFYLARKYFGAKLDYLFDETYFNDFPEMQAGYWDPSCLADCCYGIMCINQAGNEYYESPLDPIYPDNIFMAATDYGMEYHTVFTFRLYFWNGGSDGGKKEVNKS